MEDATRKELRIAAVLTAGAYVPAVVGMGLVLGTADSEGPWLMGAVMTAAIGCLLLIDVLLPVGRSKIRHGMDILAWTARVLRDNGAWYLRVLVILGVVIATQIAVDLITHH